MPPKRSSESKGDSAPSSSALSDSTRSSVLAPSSSGIGRSVDVGELGFPFESDIPTRKALTCGLLYRGTEYELYGCINDIKHLRKDFLDINGYARNYIVTLTDDTTDLPTMANMKAGLTQLVSKSTNGDILFFQYSGHGTQIPDTTGDESDRKDEAIVPIDDGVIPDDWLFENVVRPLEAKPLTHLYAFFDCCNSGTIMDLPFQYYATRPLLKTSKPTIRQAGAGTESTNRKSSAHVIVFSAALDPQLANDLGGSIPQGAFTQCFLTAYKQHQKRAMTYREFLLAVDKELATGGNRHQASISSTTKLDLDSKFEFGVESDSKTVRKVKPRPIAKELKKKIVDPVNLPFDSEIPQRKALQIGILYRDTENELFGCVNDIKKTKTAFLDKVGYESRYIIQMTDDTAVVPTSANMQSALKQLVKKSVNGDVLFFNYSGHGTQLDDTSGDDADHLDEAICPLDFDMISDDWLFANVVKPLESKPDTVLYALFDCCNSGTIMDLPYQYYATRKAKPTVVTKGAGTDAKNRKSTANVVVFSAALDPQLADDMGTNGAFTNAFLKVMAKHLQSKKLSTRDFLLAVDKILKEGGHSHQACISSTNPLKLDDTFDFWGISKIAATESVIPRPKFPIRKKKSKVKKAVKVVTYYREQ